VANVSAKRGGKVILSAILTRASNRAKLSGRTISFVLDGAAFAGNASTNTQVVATLSYTTPTSSSVRTRTIQATFHGDGTYNSKSGRGTLTVTR
jgi:hypothetical protein